VSENKPLNKKEKFICEITWGCVPIDVAFVRNSKLFQEKMNKFDQYKHLMNTDNGKEEK
jgi:hypothetical protein